MSMCTHRYTGAYLWTRIQVCNCMQLWRLCNDTCTDNLFTISAISSAYQLTNMSFLNFCVFYCVSAGPYLSTHKSQTLNGCLLKKGQLKKPKRINLIDFVQQEIVHMYIDVFLNPELFLTRPAFILLLLSLKTLKKKFPVCFSSRAASTINFMSHILFFAQ